VKQLAKNATPLDDANTARVAFIASIANDAAALKRYDELESGDVLSTDEIRLSLANFGAKQVKIESDTIGEILGEHAPISQWLAADKVVSVDTRATQIEIKLAAEHRAVLTPFHSGLAEDIKEEMPPEELENYEQMQNELSPLGGEFLDKALAMGYEGEDLENFFNQIEGMTDVWLRQNLTTTEPLRGRGLTQQWTTSCAATAAQSIRAELDPVYALDLHQSNEDISKRWNGAGNTEPNSHLATQQGQLTQAAATSGGNLVPFWLGEQIDSSFEGVKDVGKLIDATFSDSSMKFKTQRHKFDSEGIATLDRQLQQGLPVLLSTVSESGGGHGVALLAKVNTKGKQAYLVSEPFSGVVKAVATEDVTRAKFSVSGEVLTPLYFYGLSKVF